MSAHIAIKVKNTNIVKETDHINNNEESSIQSLGPIQRLLAHMGKALSLEYMVIHK